jgi:hypothetical protein
MFFPPLQMVAYQLANSFRQIQLYDALLCALRNKYSHGVGKPNAT